MPAWTCAPPPTHLTDGLTLLFGVDVDGGLVDAGERVVLGVMPEVQH